MLMVQVVSPIKASTEASSREGRVVLLDVSHRVKTTTTS